MSPVEGQCRLICKYGMEEWFSLHWRTSLCQKLLALIEENLADL
jgi:hypothetical protein